MDRRLALLFLLAFLGSLAAGCNPGAGSVKDAIKKKSICQIGNFKLTKDPEAKGGYVYYEFEAKISCMNKRSIYYTKYKAPTKVTGKAEMKEVYFGVMHDLSRYEFTPVD